MVLVHTIPNYPPGDGGGATAVVKRISEGLARRGHEVHILTSFHPDRTFDSINGVHVHSFAVKAVLSQSVLGIYGIGVEAYRHFLLEADFDVLMNYAAQNWTTDLTYPLLDRIRAKKVFIPCGFSGLTGMRRFAYFRYFARLPEYFKKYDGVVYHLRDFRDKHFGDKIGIQNYRIFPNGSDSAEFERCSVDFRAKYGITEKHILLCVGNHYKNKGHDRVIAAYNRLNRSDTALVIIGNPTENVIHNCWKSCKQAEERSVRKIRLFSELPREDVVAAFKSSDILLSGSLIEVFSLVNLEAMTAGIPFVTFPTGNVHELSGGIIVESIEDMASIVNRLADDEEERAALGASGKRQQMAEYEWEKIIEGYEKYYYELLGRA